MQAHQFVAHRGYQAEYPENTLIGVEAALDAGAKWVEIDVQFSSDGVPVVVHDPDLRRVSSSKAVIGETEWAALQDIEVGEADRFGSRFSGARLCRLRELLQLVGRYPDAAAFVEIKHHALERFEAGQIAELVLGDFDQPSTCPVISFDTSILLEIRRRSELPIGLVLTHYDQTHREWLEQNQPEWVFVNYRKPRAREPLWPGDWKWVMYPVNKVRTATRWLRKGADLIETDDIGLMLEQASAGDSEG